MANFKTAGSNRFLQFIFGSFANKRSEVALRDAFEKRPNFVLLAANLKFHATVQEVAHPARNIEAFGEVSHRPAETDPLDVAFVKHL